MRFGNESGDGCRVESGDGCRVESGDGCRVESGDGCRRRVQNGVSVRTTGRDVGDHYRHMDIMDKCTLRKFTYKHIPQRNTTPQQRKTHKHREKPTDRLNKLTNFTDRRH